MRLNTCLYEVLPMSSRHVVEFEIAIIVSALLIYLG